MTPLSTASTRLARGSLRCSVASCRICRESAQWLETIYSGKVQRSRGQAKGVLTPLTCFRFKLCWHMEKKRRVLKTAFLTVNDPSLIPQPVITSTSEFELSQQTLRSPSEVCAAWYDGSFGASPKILDEQSVKFFIQFLVRGIMLWDSRS